MSPKLREEDLAATFWRFGRQEGPEFSSFLVLSTKGRVGNYRHPNEDLWQVVQGRLAFSTAGGAVSTLFDRAILHEGAIVALAGDVRVPGEKIVHCLRRTAHPPFSNDRSSPAPNVHFLTSLRRPKRPNLVVLRAGPQSLHSSWDQDISKQERNWDLCISHYGPDPTERSEDCEYLTHQPTQRKFQALHSLFHTGSPLWDYDRIWFPDDDLATTWGDINRLFHISRRELLDLAQPALRPGPGCHINHQITARQPGLLLRHTSFVEIMCPVFSRDALRVCVGSFRDSRTGFGLDHLWPALLGWPRVGVAIIDDVSLVHTRPFGTNYDLVVATQEEVALRQAYRLGHHDWSTVEVRSL